MSLNQPLTQLFKKSGTVSADAPKKPQPKKRQTKLKVNIAFDIGSFNTKMLVGREKNGRLYMDQILSMRTPDKACMDGMVSEADNLSKMLASLSDQSRSTSKDMVFSIESSKIIKREFIIPQIPEEDIAGLVTYEMGQYLPIDISQYSIQHKLTRSIEEEGVTKNEVSVSAVPKDIIQSYQQLFATVGLRPVAMNINANSIEKLIQYDMAYNPVSEYGEKNVVFIDMGHSGFNVSFYENGIYQFNRIIEIGGRMIDTLLLESLQMKQDQVFDIKRELCEKISVVDLDKKYGHVPDNYQPQNPNEKVLIELTSTFSQWIGQIDRVLQYMTRSRERSIDNIYLYGGSSLIKGLDTYLANKLHIPIAKANFPNICEFSQGIATQNLTTTHGNALGAFVQL